jgi:uncharacterized protein YbjQ (UPF0145 family)
MIGFLINLLLPVLALIVFYFTGRTVERRHLKRLAEQEAGLSHIRVEQLKSLPRGWVVTSEPILVYGSVVLANDRFKVFISALKKIVGGRLYEYERLVDRGRREAIIRMKQMAADHGCNVVWNMRIETSMLSDSQSRTASSAELYAYGTAMRVQSAP